VQIHQRRMDECLVLVQFGTLNQGNRQQFRSRDQFRHRWVRHQVVVGRMQPVGMIQTQKFGQASGSHRDIRLSSDQLGVAQLQFRCRPFRVRREPLPGFRIRGRDPGRLARFLLSLKCGTALRLSSHQFQINDRHLHQYLVAIGGNAMRGSIAALPHFVVVVKALADVQVVLDSGDVDRPGSDGVRSGADIHRVSVDVQNVAIGLLQSTAMHVVVSTQVDVRQRLGCCILLAGRRGHGALHGNQDLRVLNSRQGQRGREIDRGGLVFEVQSLFAGFARGQQTAARWKSPGGFCLSGNSSG